MSNLKKTIQINPELFRLSGSKTKKNREKKEIPTPIISPSNLKNKLLNRIKEHKNKELKEKDKDSVKNEKKEYTDEFNGALDYLTDLSRKSKKSITNSNSHNHTIKNHYSNNNAYPHVELELPPELQPTLPLTNNQSNIKLNYRVDNEIPHGCLRGGQKPTYRNWHNQTRKTYNEVNNNSIINTNSLINPSTSNPVNVGLSREDRLKSIKNKLKNMETKNNISSSVDIKPTVSIINSTPSIIDKKEDYIIPLPTIPSYNNPDIDINKDVNKDVNIDIDIENDKDIKLKNIQCKKYIKKTIKRKYTLGKSNIYRKVGVLIKDKQTRKNIVNAHKELKKTSIGEVKKYLRNHGIIKVGSTAPNDVLRKTYESARLAGEITNTNKDILLHNFLNGEENN